MREKKKRTRRLHLNALVDASLVYLDDHHLREGTRIKFGWLKDGSVLKPLSVMEFDDHVMPLTRWRDATFGTIVGSQVDENWMDQPLILDSVVEHATRRALEKLAKYMPGLGRTTSSDPGPTP